MKKFIALLLTFSILFLLAGCDNVDENNSNTVYTSEYVTINDDTVKILIDNKSNNTLTPSELTTDVDYRIETGALTEYIDTYTDANGNAYSYGRTSGRLLSYSESNHRIGSIRNDIKEENKISQQNARQIAETFLSKFIDLSKYSLDNQSNDTYFKNYFFSYVVKIDQYSTNDFITISIYYDGKIRHFNAPNVGAFEGVTIPEIDKKEVKKGIVEQVKEKYPDCKYKLEPIDNDILIDLQGKIFMEATVTIEYTKGNLKGCEDLVTFKEYIT